MRSPNVEDGSALAAAWASALEALLSDDLARAGAALDAAEALLAAGHGEGVGRTEFGRLRAVILGKRAEIADALARVRRGRAAADAYGTAARTGR